MRKMTKAAKAEMLQRFVAYLAFQGYEVQEEGYRRIGGLSEWEIEWTPITEEVLTRYIAAFLRAPRRPTAPAPPGTQEE